MEHLSPDTLEHYFRSGTVTTHDLGEHPHVLLIIDAPRQTISVTTPRDGTTANFDTLQRVSTSFVRLDGAEWVRLTLDARGMYAEAYGLLLSVVRAMRGGATFAAAASAAMMNMRALLAARSSLSEQKQIGLFGELLVLDALLESHDEADAVEWWLGPLAEERDFAFPAFDAEIKTTLSEHRSHVIHGAGQLDPTPGRSLWLVSIQITRAGGDPNGLRLHDLIEKVSDRLTANRERFSGHLASQGWHIDDIPIYRTAYTLRTRPAAFQIDDGFPAMTPARLRAMVPHSDLVSDITYRVNLTGRTPGEPGDPLDTFIAMPNTQED